MPQRDDIPGSQLPSAIPDDEGPGVEAPVGEAPPGYEILGELGRGGMGVVYKARDRRLKRVVALKMLLGGAHAGGDGRVRFHNEAEAVARLAHPNIVSVYEVGSHRGLPFLAMEYCGGGTLSAAVGGRPQNPRRAATLLASVARAVQAAHDAGIVHRDLKPGNILFTAGGEGPGRDAAVPKVADFGLAKRLDSDGTSDPTRTGAALGTPAYMAPEQMNDARRVGPAADIYALGAILYELLTGRPPFLAESEANAVYLVMTQKPVGVRRLQPKIPADLETICHRCLAKEPQGRYRSAGELAADLTRFLRGEPIKARPVGSLERTVRWVRRHPAWAGLLGVSAAALLAGVAGLAAFADRERRAARDLAEQRDRVVAEQTRTAEQRDRAEAARAETEAARAEAERERDRAERARAEAETNHRRAEENFALARRAVAECLDLARRDPVFQAPGAEAAKALLLRTAVPYHERFARSGGGSADVRREFAAAGFEAGLAGGAVSAKLEAVASFRKALPELRRLSEENPADAGRLYEWATCHNNIGALLMEIGRPEEALADLAAGLELMRRLSAAHPDNPEYRNDLAAAHGNIAGLHLYTGRPAEGLAVYVELDRFLQSLIAAFPQKADYYEDLSLCRVNAAAALDAMGRVSESLERLDQARTAIGPLRRGSPDHVRVRAAWADLRHRRAHRLADLGRFAEAFVQPVSAPERPYMRSGRPGLRFCPRHMRIADLWDRKPNGSSSTAAPGQRVQMSTESTWSVPT
jgi:tetratricopeptide (TPR) repeat protein